MILALTSIKFLELLTNLLYTSGRYLRLAVFPCVPGPGDASSNIEGKFSLKHSASRMTQQETESQGSVISECMHQMMGNVFHALLLTVSLSKHNCEQRLDIDWRCLSSSSVCPLHYFAHHLEASPGAVIFRQDMLFDVLLVLVADWQLLQNDYISSSFKLFDNTTWNVKVWLSFWPTYPESCKPSLRRMEGGIID